MLRPRRYHSDFRYLRTVSTDQIEGVTSPLPTTSGSSSAQLTASLDATQDRRAHTPPVSHGALGWVNVGAIASGEMAAEARTGTDLLADLPRRSIFRPAVLVPFGVVALSCAAYAATTALWPLHAIAPTIEAATVQTAPAPAAAVTWPGVGSAAMGIEGLSDVASSEELAPMASITKVVTVLAALDRMPLAPGEQGPVFEFTDSDSDDYWEYRESDQSALDVPVDGSMTQYQLFQGILLGSANNYADRLSDDIWGSDAAFVEAGTAWLQARGLTGVSLENPSGFGFDNVATPRALLKLAASAVNNPVIAEIVKTPVADIPGAGTVTNTNQLLEDPGMLGVKTGTIGDGDETLYNLLSAKDIMIDGTTVRVYASVLGQPDGEQRVGVSRAMYAELESMLNAQAPTVPAGTVLGTAKTAWGESVDVVTPKDTRVVLWNAAAATTSGAFEVGDDWTKGATVGTLTVTGPLNTNTVDAELADEIEGPSFWWRLTHPLELFGLTDK